MINSSKWWFVAWLLVIILLVFHPVLTAEFLRWDDGLYIYDNPIIQSLGWRGLIEIFSTQQVVGTYSPIVLLSWTIDNHFFGLDASWFHTMNVVWHGINTLLVFALILKWTNRPWLALFVCGFFAIHPMHVEAVAWATGRKDLLLGFFSLSSLLAYHQFMLHKRRRWYVLALGLFGLALMSKAVAVVIPLILLLADVLVYNKPKSVSILYNKVPLFIMSLVFGVVAILGQTKAEAFSVRTCGFWENQLFVLQGFFQYLIKVLVPYRLSSFHPYPNSYALTSNQWIWFSAFLGVMLFAVLLYRLRKNRVMLFGLLFFVLWLLPTMQFKPFGMTIIAERYTYISYVGVFLTLGLAISSFTEQVGPNLKKAVVILVISSFSVHAVMAHQYCWSWTNDKTLWSNVRSAYPMHYMAYFKLGTWEVKQGDPAKAMRLFNQSIERSPTFSDAFANRGMLLLENGEAEKALADFDRAIELDSSNALAWMNRGVALLGRNRYTEALAALNTAGSLDNEISHLIHYNIGRIYESQKSFDQARQHYRSAYKERPSNTEFLYRYARTEAVLFNLVKAEQLVTESLVHSPSNTELLILLSEVQATKGEFRKALNSALQARNFGAMVNEAYLQKLNDRIDSIGDD